MIGLENVALLQKLRHIQQSCQVCALLYIEGLNAYKSMKCHLRSYTCLFPLNITPLTGYKHIKMNEFIETLKTKCRYVLSYQWTIYIQCVIYVFVYSIIESFYFLTELNSHFRFCWDHSVLTKLRITYSSLRSETLILAPASLLFCIQSIVHVCITPCIAN